MLGALGTGDSSPSLELQSLPTFECRPCRPRDSAGEGGSQFNLRDVERKQMGKGSRRWARGKYPDDFRGRKSPQPLPAVLFISSPQPPHTLPSSAAFNLSSKTYQNPVHFWGLILSLGSDIPLGLYLGRTAGRAPLFFELCSFGVTQLYHVLHGKDGLPPRKGLLVCSHCFKQ